jgi:hypothetical protein
MNTPYTYLIGWSDLNAWYYGVRFSKKCSPEELWKTYFTSSKHVKRFREEHGEPDVVEIRKTFQSEQLARLWEHKVLKRLNAPKNDKWLNKTDNKSIYNDKETCAKIALANTGKKRSNPHPSKGNPRPASRGKIPWNKGKKNVQLITEEMKKERSELTKKRWESGVYSHRPKPTEESNLKRKETLQGRTFNEQHRARLSENKKKYYAELRLRNEHK